MSTALTVFSMYVIWGMFVDGFGTYSHFIRLDRECYEFRTYDGPSPDELQ